MFYKELHGLIKNIQLKFAGTLTANVQTHAIVLM